MELKFGNIGIEDIEKAKSKLVSTFKCADGTWQHKNIWIEKIDTPKGYRAYVYSKVDEVIKYKIMPILHTFKNITQVKKHTKVYGYVFNKNELNVLNDIFNEGRTAYMVDGLIGDNPEFLIAEKCKSGQYIFRGTPKDAYHLLDTCVDIDILVQLVVIGILR